MNSRLQKPASILLLVLGAIILVWDALLFLSPVKTTIWNYYYNAGYALLYLFGAGIGMFGAMRVSTKTTIGKALLYLGLGQAAYAIGLIFWVYYNLIVHTDVPYPSLADGFFLLGFIPFMTIGCLYVLTIYHQILSPRRLIEAGLIFVVVGAIVFGFLNTPDISSGVTPAAKFFNILYPFGDSILLTLAFLALRASGGKLQAVLLLLVIGFFFQVSGDLIFSYRTSQELYWNGDIADVCYTLSAILLGLGITTLAYSGENTLKKETPAVSAEQTL